MDAYTIMLLLGTGWGANQITLERTGRSIITRVTDPLDNWNSFELPEKAMNTKERLRMAKEARDANYEARLKGEVYGVEADVKSSKILAELRGKKVVEKPLVDKIWMGSEGDDWKEKRDARERKALEEGKGYGWLIMDQIWDVWTWGKNKTEEVKEKDEEVIAEKKEGKKQ